MAAGLQKFESQYPQIGPTNRVIVAIKRWKTHLVKVGENLTVCRQIVPTYFTYFTVSILNTLKKCYSYLNVLFFRWAWEIS